jgi:hypothetical protein
VFRQINENIETANNKEVLHGPKKAKFDCQIQPKHTNK